MFSHHHTTQNTSTSLYTDTGERKYLTASERQAFIDKANLHEQSVRLLCLVLVYTGCRLTEALNLKPEHIIPSENIVLIRSLKKRNKITYRSLALPDDLINELLELGQIHQKQLFQWKRTYALQLVKETMAAAGIQGIRSTARGLRHTFGTHAIRSGVPLTLIQRWLGHSNIQMTAIYTQIIGPEEREIAEKMW